MLVSLDGEDVLQHFSVVKVVLHALDFLVVFMTLASYQHHIAFLGQHTGGADGFAAVGDRQYFLHLLRGKPSEHIIDNGLGLLVPWIVARDDDTVALSHSLLGTGCMQEVYTIPTEDRCQKGM